MVHELRGNPKPKKSSFVEGMLGGLSQGLAPVLQEILGNRKMAAKQQQTEENYEKLGLPPELSKLDPKIQELFLKDRSEKEKQEKLSQILSGGHGNEQESIMKNPHSSPANNSQIAQLATVDKDVASLLQRQKDNAESAEIRRDKNTITSNENLKKQTRHQENQIADSHKFNKEFTDEVDKGYQQYKATNARLGRMEQLLNNKEDLPEPLLVSTLESLGIPLGSLENATAEEFQKLSKDLTTGINDDYKGRILESEFNTFLQRIPDLKNSPEGRHQILENIKLINDLKKIRYNAYKEIKSKYKGKALPYDLRDEVTDQMQEKADKWTEKFLERNGRYSVPIGTPLDENTLQRYTAISSTPQEAAEKAYQDGYRWEPKGQSK